MYSYRQGMFLLGFLGLSVLVACSTSSQRDEALAKVNTREITVRDFEMALSKVSELPIKNYDKQENRTGLLRDMIDEELLYQEAVKAKMMERSYPVKQAMVREYLKERYSAKLASVNEEEVKDFFEKNKPLFSQVKASHILIKTTENSESSDAQALDKIKRIRQNYLNDPSAERFAALAKKYSEDPGTKSNGGDLGYFNAQTMVKEFTETSFALEKVGDISEPFKTQFGYHIILLTGDKRSFKLYENEIRAYLLQQKNKQMLTDELAELRSDASIKVYADHLEKMVKKQ